jgi:hypothetical protein
MITGACSAARAESTRLPAQDHREHPDEGPAAPECRDPVRQALSEREVSLELRLRILRHHLVLSQALEDFEFEPGQFASLGLEQRLHVPVLVLLEVVEIQPLSSQRPTSRSISRATAGRTTIALRNAERCVVSQT